MLISPPVQAHDHPLSQRSSKAVRMTDSPSTTDASKFLAQSQSRFSFGQPEPEAADRTPLDRRRRANGGPSRFPAPHSYLQRSTMPNPYQPSASQTSRLSFASRLAPAPAPAPLFYSATDEFREEDDGAEHEREVADYYALQRSRRQFGAGHLEESSEIEEEDGSGIDHSGGVEVADIAAPGFGRGIRSSWKGGKISTRGRTKGVEPVQEKDERERSTGASEADEAAGKGKGRLVDVELASTARDSLEEVDRQDASGDVALDLDDQPPAFQQLRTPPAGGISRSPMQHYPIPRETDSETIAANPRPFSPDRESVPPIVQVAAQEPPRHDALWAALFWISVASLFATYFLVLLHTSAPSTKKPLGDTVYTVLHSSYHLLAVYTLVASIVGSVWLWTLKYHVRPVMLLIAIAAPVILFSFSLWPLVSSYNGRWHGNSIQDKALRWLSVIPGFFAVLWVYTAWRGRHSFAKAGEVLELASKVLTASPSLMFVGVARLAVVILWTWIWLNMFSRVFLEGHFSAKRSFIIDTSTWWLGVFFVLVYLWTLSVASGVHRATTAATVSQWYFHRLAVPAPSSRMIVQASVNHATTTIFGTICASTFLSLAVRLPLLLLPRRLAGLVSLFAYSLIPTPIATLTNPLTLTYAAIHSQPLGTSARALSYMSFVSKTSPTTTLSPSSFSSPRGSTLLPYRLAKLILLATRLVMVFALGFGGWVNTARLLKVSGEAGVLKGSLYAYVVGLVAATIGWAVLGAMEGVLGGVLDALVVCWGSEVGAQGFGEARFCREAGDVFGERGRF